jgi:uncharacterized protein
MSLRVLEATYTNVFRSGLVTDKLRVLWHAGEPLSLRPDYYSSAIELGDSLKPPSLEISYGIQTNGTLITREWCQLFKTYGVAVGISLDGPAHFHDARRRTRSHGATHNAVLRGLCALRDCEVNFYVICVLSGESVKVPEELFEFFELNGVTEVAFSIDEIKGQNGSSSFALAENERAYRDFYARYLDLLNDRNSFQTVRDIKELAGYIVNPSVGTVTNYMNTPAAYISVDWQGYFSTFSPELLTASHPRFADFRMGNVERDEIGDLAKSAAFQRVWAEIRAGTERCRRSCDYFPVCGGGSPASKLFETGSFDAAETMQCRLMVKALADIMLGHLQSHTSFHAQVP